MGYNDDYRPDAWEDSGEVARYGGRSNELRRLMRDASRRAAMYNQGETWVNAQGLYVPIETISARYADNILSHLRDHAREDMELVLMWSNRNVSDVSFDPTDEEVQSWLRGTQLYMALEEASERPF